MVNIDKWSLLAGLRFVLASIVAWKHLGEFTVLGSLSVIPMLGTFEAILGFLLISGFSISLSYLKEPQGFLLRRFKRIYPIYLASLFLTLLVTIEVEHLPAPSSGYLLLNALFLNQLFTTTSFVGPAWSLSLEFWLYCLAPFLMVARSSLLRSITWLSFTAFVVYTGCRSLFHWPYYSGLGYGANLPLLAFIWICGLRLARAGEESKMVMWDIRVVFAGYIAAVVGIQLLSDMKHHTMGLFISENLMDFVFRSITLLGIYLMFSRWVLVPQEGKKRSRFLRLLGDASYPLYLIHSAVFQLLKKTSLVSPVAYYLITVAAAVALYALVDVYSRKRHLQIVAT